MSFKFGTGREIITPPFKTCLACSQYYGKPYKEIHDDVYVKALILNDGNTYALIISYDLLFHDPSLNIALKEYAYEKYDVPKDNTIVCYTHTHNSPSSKGYDSYNASIEYEDFLLSRGKSCIDRAFTNIFDGSIHYGVVEGNWNISRRLNVDGVVEMKPNLDGPRDNDIYFLEIRDKNGQTRSILLNYACHPVHYPAPTMISAEYPGRLCQLLEAKYYGSTVIFTQGAGANARPRGTAKTGTWKSCSFEEIDDMSSVMADNVERAICSNIMEEIDLSLKGVVFKVKLPIEVQPKEYFEQMAESDNIGPLHRKNAIYVAKNYDSIEENIDLICGILKLSNDLCITHMGGEPVYEVKQLVETALEDKKIIFIGYTDAIAYIVDDRLLAEGGYESDCFLEYALKGRFKPGIDRRIIEGYRRHSK